MSRRNITTIQIEEKPTFTRPSVKEEEDVLPTGSLLNDFYDISPQTQYFYDEIDPSQLKDLNQTQRKILNLVGRTLALPLLEKITRLNNIVSDIETNYRTIAEELYRNNYEYIVKLLFEQILNKTNKNDIIDDIKNRFINESNIRSYIEQSVDDYFFNTSNVDKVVNEIKNRIGEKITAEDIFSQQDIARIIQNIINTINKEVTSSLNALSEDFPTEDELFEDNDQ